MNAVMLLSRLEGVKETGPGRWVAKCPAHDDTSPSLSIRELGDGRILLHCFAGCAATDVLAAIGLTLSDLFDHPLRNITLPAGNFHRERQPFHPIDTLRLVARECLICALAASDAVAGKEVSEVDAQRTAFAVGRIFAALDAVGGGP
ncbi:hypothetical protein [Ferrovum sp.]|uniref:hypothetical protein n=1 Tax=Ferrovum sp. TaxID=2609467 RepID=UPI0026073F41|nr:hypothetical protein [Ferrovum sp.]